MSFQEPELYAECSADHQREVKELLESWSDVLRWGTSDSVLDIGCGTGDVTHNALLPKIPHSFERLVGVDLSEKMIKYAQGAWESEKVSFAVMDIGAPTLPPFLTEGTFDKVFSFFCLQWVKDRKAACRNIEALLKPGGQALLQMVVKNGIYQAWDTIAQEDKWKTHLKDTETPLNEYQYMCRPDVVLKEELEENGLVVEKCRLEFKQRAFRLKEDTDEEFMRRLKTVDPFHSLLPEHLKGEYLKDLVDLIRRLEADNGDYDSLILLASKPSTLPP